LEKSERIQYVGRYAELQQKALQTR